MASEQQRQLLLHQGQHLALLPLQRVSYRAGLNPHSALLQLNSFQFYLYNANKDPTIIEIKPQ